MIRGTKELKAVTPQQGKPLYALVKHAIRDAIDAGVFLPGQQMPSTKELSEQLSVSLVTAHRALQDLVSAGVLQRAQGRGTFVHERYLDRKSQLSGSRIGLVFHPDVSLADFYHSQILEGIRQGSQSLAVDLVLLRFGEDARRECNGYLFVNPEPQDLDKLGNDLCSKLPKLIVGARSSCPKLYFIDVENIALARAAVEHLVGLGHQRIGYVGGDDRSSNSNDRWQGFCEECTQRSIALNQENILKSNSWHLHEHERQALTAVLKAPTRPTAIFAAGYFFALDVYSAASAAGLRIGEDLSVIAVDDPPSAALLAPPLTTMRQPLLQLGHAALTTLAEGIASEGSKLENKLLKAELIIRRSSGLAVHDGKAPCPKAPAA